MILTESILSTVKAPFVGQIEIGDHKVPGLRVRIGANGNKSFVVRKRVGEKIKVVTLGRYGPRLGLGEARKLARSVLNDIESGSDVTSVQHGVLTVRKLWPAYERTKIDHKSLPEIRRIFKKYILPNLGDRFADAVTRGEITRFIDAIPAPVMARAIHAQLSAFYSWALPRLDRLQANPCTGAGRPAKPRPRERILSDAELAALWRAAELERDPWSSAIKLLILTGQRRSEVFGAMRSEFDLETGYWIIPAGRSKNYAQNRVPLSPRASSVFTNVAAVRGSPRLFPAVGNTANSASGISKVVNRLREAVSKDLEVDVPRWSLHDIRRTVATGLQKLGVRFEVTEAILNHVSGSKGGVAGIYQRYNWGPEKEQALNSWAEYVAGCVDRHAKLGSNLPEVASS